VICQASCFWGMYLNTDKVWKQYGEVDPYFGVISHSQYHSGGFTDQVRDEFFQSGERQSEILMQTLREINPGFSPTRTIDFGCGVGRLTLALACESTSVLGVDISPGMLSEAQKNATERGVSNVRFAHEISGRFDLVHSFIVLQHIPPRRGLPIVRDLVSRVEPGGMVVLQVPYHASVWRRLKTRVVHVDPITKRVRNLVQGRALNYPLMTMYCYNISSILDIFHDAGIDNSGIRMVPDSAAGRKYSSMTLYGWNRHG
jgi:2-polyprenyl-3-methyl-5-hydroxy-6-metoxy-1,4-benzoquinol methylase